MDGDKYRWLTLAARLWWQSADDDTPDCDKWRMACVYATLGTFAHVPATASNDDHLQAFLAMFIAALACAIKRAKLALICPGNCKTNARPIFIPDCSVSLYSTGSQAIPGYPASQCQYCCSVTSSASASALGEEVFTELAVLHYGAYASNPNCRVVFVTADKTLAGLVRKILQQGPVVSYPTEVLPTLVEARDWLDSQPQLHLMSNVMGFRLD